MVRVDLVEEEPRLTLVSDEPGHQRSAAMPVR